MIIHFIGSKGNITQEIDYYQAIVDSIKQYGHTLAQDWVDVVYKAATKSNEWDKEINWRDIDKENTAAISKADLVIVESTKRSFFVGYGVAQAVHQKKPVLILVRDDSFPGIKYLSDASDIIYGAQYDLKTLDSVIGKFLEENTIETKDMRFNFFIDRAIYNYLRWAAFKTGKTKAEVLRELVQREIEKKDY
jgi:hypothetical protein